MGDHLENEQKARASPAKFLRERFQNALLTDVITLKLQYRERRALHEAADRLKVAASPIVLFHESVVAPKLADGTTPAEDKWVVVGRDRSAVQEKLQEVSREAARIKQRIEEAREETITSRMKISASNDTEWDVGGLWDITFKESRVNWGSKNYRSSLQITFVQLSGGSAQIWAKFNFPAIKGVFRFLTPGFNEKNSKEHENDKFYLGINEKPSPKCHKWNYRWRGEDKYEEKVFNSESRLGSITFGGAGGMVLTGVFDSEWTFGEISFMSSKTGPTPRFPSDDDWEIIDHEWNLRDKSSRKWSKS